MNKVAIILLSLLVLNLVSCSAWEQANNPEGDKIIVVKDSLSYNPCNDSLYKIIKLKSLNDMSEREYTYFMEKEKQCADFRNTVESKKPQEEIAKTYKTNSTVWYALIGVAVILTVIAIYSIPKMAK